jgi:PAS domain S-box-containing protein
MCSDRSPSASPPDGAGGDEPAIDFNAIFDALPKPTLVLRPPDYVMVAANQARYQVTNTRAEDVIGRKLFDVFPDNPDDPGATGVANLTASLRRVMQTRRADVMAVQKYDIHDPSGAFEERWWSPINTPVLGHDGSVRYIIHQVEDVTAEIRERQRATYAEAEHIRCLQLADAIPGLVFESDTECSIVYVNDQFPDYTGLPREALLDDGWCHSIHPSERDEMVDGWCEAIRTGQDFERECRILSAAGEWRWFTVRGTLLRDQHGLVERAIGICTDIDDVKRAEAELRESEERFRTMADSLPQLAWMADADGWIYWYNRRWYEYTGTSLDEMQGWGWRKVHHPDHVDRVVERISHSWRTGEPWEDTFPLRGADGHYRWFLSRATPLRDGEGHITRWFGTNTDITAKQELEELQSLLMRELSHRVKNSLSLVSALLHLQARNADWQTRTALTDAAARVQAVATVHDQLWRQADAREIDLKPFLTSLAAALAESAPQHQTTVQVEPATLSADMAVPIGLLVNELVTNAYKYAYPPGSVGEVRILGHHRGEGNYAIEVSDSGGGLPRDFNIDRPGTSLGMRMISTLTKQLGGRITAGAANPGARFTISFALGRAEASNGEAHRARIGAAVE